MSIATRLTRAEGGIGDALLWQEAIRTAAETGESPQAIFDDVKRTLRKYQHLEVPLPDGRIDVMPVLRAMAEGEGYDLVELVADVRLLLRRQAARERRRLRR